MRRLLVILTIVLFPSLGYAVDNPAIVDIQVRPTSEGASVEMEATNSFPFITYTLTNPDRLVFDPVEDDVESRLPNSGRFPGGLIRSWQLFRLGASGASRVDYIAFDLTEPSEHQMEAQVGKLVIRVRPKSSLPSSGLGPWDMAHTVQFALTRYRPVAIGQQEIELAQMKLREAHRALFPAATLRTSWTTGAASAANFTEVNSGLQLEQPLYQSGRLIETYRQALVNLQVSEKRSSKVKADFSFEVAQAYLQLMGAQKSFKIQEELVGQALDFWEKGKRRFEEGLLTLLELLTIENQFQQAKFQRSSAENDVTLARLKLLQRMRLSPEATIDLPPELPSDLPREMDLEELLRFSVRYRPDIHVNSLLVQFHEFEERIAKAKGKLRVDLSGFVGASGAAFETETLMLDKDYFIGIKASQAWGPHGMSVSATTTKTSPRLGQSTRTDSTVVQGELGLFNQLAGQSEIQQARIGLEKARQDLDEVKATVFQEVHEAYLSYNKARLQLEYARKKVIFREEQVKILEAQASLNEILPSQVAEALMRLYDERSGEIQAMVNLQVALAKLNKAIGVPGYFQSIRSAQ